MIDPAIFKKKCIIPYVTFGDPNPQFTETLIKESFDSGADIIEVGFPFSDPIADGPVIQESHQRALENCPNLNLKESSIDHSKSQYSNLEHNKVQKNILDKNKKKICINILNKNLRKKVVKKKI